MARMRECYLCGTTYKYCPNCASGKTMPSWMMEFHSEECKNIFDICTRFNMGELSKADAKSELAKYDLSNKEKFKPYVQRDLEKILAEEPKRERRSKMTLIDKVLNTEAHEVVTENDKAL